jgi:hypothetical protein
MQPAGSAVLLLQAWEGVVQRPRDLLGLLLLPCWILAVLRVSNGGLCQERMVLSR